MTIRPSRLFGTLVSTILAVSVLAVAPGRAADLSNEPPAAIPADDLLPGWEFTIAPYVWGAGISGTVRQFGLPAADIDQSFGDILKSLDFAGMIIGEARYNRFSVSTDFNYVRTSASSNTPFGILATSVGVNTSTLRWTALGGYEVFSTERFRLDINAGFQLSSAQTQLAFTGGLLNGRKPSDGATWIDGMGGLKARFLVTPKIFLSSWGLIGAGESDLVWDVMGGAGYNFNDHISAFLGYRANGVDFQRGGFIYDVVQHGPVTGVVLRF